jgi:hypothetical protein
MGQSASERAGFEAEEGESENGAEGKVSVNLSEGWLQGH